MPEAIFITNDNGKQYLRETLDWLEKDFIDQKEPEGHFWHNRSPIAKAFERCEAMVVLNEQRSVVGYMTWNMDLPSVYVEIVEIKKAYRRQGFYKHMESVLLNRFPEIIVLTAYVIESSKPIFKNMGWQSVTDMNRVECFYKPVCPLVKPENTLPDGRVIALCPVNFYQVEHNREQYQKKMQYFRIDLATSVKLKAFVVTNFHYEHYVGIYFNKKLLAEGKEKHLFQTYKRHLNGSLLMIDQVDIKEEKLSRESEFFRLSNEAISNKQEPELKDSYALSDNTKHQEKTGLFKQGFEKKKTSDVLDLRIQKKHQPEHSHQLFTQSKKKVISDVSLQASQAKETSDSTDKGNILSKGQ